MNLLRWYAVRTASNHEKSVADRLRYCETECFLPLYQAPRRWKNRTTNLLELPLFPGYVFARIRLDRKLPVLTTQGVIALVGAGSKPIPIADHEIELLATRITNLDPMPYPNMKIGDRVRVKRGPLAGVCGVLVKAKSSFRLVIAMDLLMQSIAVEVDAADIEPAGIAKSQVGHAICLPPKSPQQPSFEKKLMGSFARA